MIALALFACAPAPTPEVVPEPVSEPAPAGRFREPTRADAMQDELEALGYLSGTNDAPSEQGVVRHDRERTAPGANLYVSGQGPEAHLIDAEGRVLHRWSRPWSAQWPVPERRDGKAFPDHWRRAHLLDGGDLLVIWGGWGMARLDRDSRLVWGVNTERIHHDLDVDDQGRIWTLSRRPTREPALHADGPVILDDIVVYDQHGNLQRRIPLIHCFANSRYAPAIARWPTHGDVLHTNTISILRDGDPRPEFADGNLLVSFRRTDTIAVIDPKAQAVVWMLTGQWRAQHQPVLLPDGNLLLFDNQGLGERSRVLEIDPFSQRPIWQYGAADGENFYSKILGSVQRLPNGNTLISESDNGRAIEVTREGERVWEYVLPHRAGERGELVASLYEMVRLPPELDLSWADPATVRAAPAP